MRKTSLSCDGCGKKIADDEAYVHATSSLIDPGGEYEIAFVERHYHLEHAPTELGIEPVKLPEVEAA